MVKKLLGMLLIFCIFLGGLPCQAETVNLDNNIKATVDFYKSGGNNLSSWSDWQSIVALYGAGEDLHSNIWVLPEWSKSEYEGNGELFKHIQHIMAGVALGNNPENLDGLNIFDELLNINNSGSLASNNNFMVWFNIVVNVFGLNYDKEVALQKLLSAQHSSGAFLVRGVADVDLTGMALTALSFYKGQEQADIAIEKALTFLKTKQLDSGAFKSIFYGENSNTTAVVITGLIDVGEDIFSEKWSVNGKTPVDGLLSFQLATGGFKYKPIDTVPNQMATNQALIALGDVKAGKSAYKRLGETWQVVKLSTPTPTIEATATPTPMPTPEVTPTPTPESGGGSTSSNYAYIKVIGDKSSGIMYSRKKMKIGADETPYTLINRIASVDISGSGSSIYVKEIDDLGEFDRGPESGWKYTINGEEMDVSANAYSLKNGDEVVWFYYGESVSSSTKSTKATPTPTPTVTPKPTPTPFATPNAEAVKMADDLKKSVEALEKISEGESDWIPFAYSLANSNVMDKIRINLIDGIAENEGEYSKVTDLEKAIINCAAVGFDNIDVKKYRLLEQLYEHNNVAMQGVNGLAFGLLAYDYSRAETPANALITREYLVGEILNYQNTDGGFSLVQGKASDVDLTAIVLTALAPYKAQDKVKNAVEKAFEWLDGQKSGNFGFMSSDGVESSESLAWVIIARATFGLDCNDYVNRLKGFMLEDGAFVHVIGGNADVIATEQGIFALSAFFRQLNGQNGIFVGETKAKKDMLFSDDVYISDWAMPYIKKAKEYGIVKGDSEGNVNPKDRLSRAELITMLMRAIGESENKEIDESFEDVKKDSWYYGYVMRANALGMAKGKDEGIFDPLGTVTRQETAVIVARLLKLDVGDVVPEDFENVSTWARDSVMAVFGNGIMSGDGKKFEPMATMTREMAIKIITSVYERNKNNAK